MRFSKSPPLIKLFLQPGPLGGGVAFELGRRIGEFAAELFFEFFGDLPLCRFPCLGEFAVEASFEFFGNLPLCRLPRLGEFAVEAFFEFFGNLLSRRFPHIGDCARHLGLGLGPRRSLCVTDCGLKPLLKFLLERLMRFRNDTVELRRKRR